MTTKERRLTRGMTREVDPYLSEEDTSQEDLEVMGPRRPGSNGTRRLGRNGTQRPGSNGTRDRGFTFENDQQLVCGSEQKHDSLKDDADFNAIMGAATTGFALGVGGYFLREILDGLQSGKETKKQAGGRKTEEKSVSDLLLGAAVAGVIGGANCGVMKAMELADLKI